MRLKELNYRVSRWFYGTTREMVARRLCRLLPRPEHARSPEGARRHLDELERQGFSFLEDLCPASEAEALRVELAGVPLRDPHRPELGPFDRESIPEVTHVAQLDPAALVRSPRAMALANHPRVLSVVEAWLGARPTALFTAWWSVPRGGVAEHAELFHRDKDDWRFIKLFVYLTDVDETTGPHVYVPGSHKYHGPEFRRQRRYSDAEVGAVFAPSAWHRFVGPRGTAFLENTFGLHRGLPPERGERLVFQVTYSLFPLLYAPERPEIGASELSARYDPYVNRLYVDPER